MSKQGEIRVHHVGYLYADIDAQCERNFNEMQAKHTAFKKTAVREPAAKAAPAKFEVASPSNPTKAELNSDMPSGRREVGNMG